MKMKRTLLFLLLTATGILLHAQTLPLLYNPTDPRSLAMGGAGVALEADAWALDNNFAAAALSTKTFTSGVTYLRWAPNPSPDDRFAAGGWYRMDRLAIGLSAKGSFSQPYDIVSPSGKTTGRFEPRDLSLAVGAAWMPYPGLSLSAGARMVSSSLGEELSGLAVCGDLAVQYAYGPVRAGLSAANLGAPIRYGDTSYPLPALVRGGFTYGSLWVDGTVEIAYLFRTGMTASIGVEARPLEQTGQPRSWLTLRAGYHLGAENRGLPSFGSCGIGLYFSGLSIDFSLLFASPTLGMSLCAGVSYSF